MRIKNSFDLKIKLGKFSSKAIILMRNRNGTLCGIRNNYSFNNSI